MENRKQLFLCDHICFCGIRAASVFIVKVCKVEDASYGETIQADYMGYVKSGL
jgi:hypothetical protein